MRRNLIVLLDVITLYLSIEFLIGMYINVYITITPGAGDVTEPFLFAHIFFGILLFVFSGFTTAYAYFKKAPKQVTFMIFIGTLLILITGIFGMLFIFTLRPLYTYLMAAFFLFIFAPIGFATSGVRSLPKRVVEAEKAKT